MLVHFVNFTKAAQTGSTFSVKKCTRLFDSQAPARPLAKLCLGDELGIMEARVNEGGKVEGRLCTHRIFQKSAPIVLHCFVYCSCVQL